MKSAIFGGEGFFFASLTGPGKVWLQSLPFSRLADRIYAARLERVYKNTVEPKLRRHAAMGPLALLQRAAAEVEPRPYRWARFSVDGSLPARRQVSNREWRHFVPALRSLVSRLSALGARWHIPVESAGKARTYRKALEGLGVVVRRSSQAKSVAQLLESADHRSWVVAEKIHRGRVTEEEKARNTAAAFAAARQARDAGQSAIVCPAIASNSKCGQCTGCADKNVDVVFYPFHG